MQNIDTSITNDNIKDALQYAVRLYRQDVGGKALQMKLTNRRSL